VAVDITVVERAIDGAAIGSSDVGCQRSFARVHQAVEARAPAAAPVYRMLATTTDDNEDRHRPVTAPPAQFGYH
jgi:hypothetical protein